MSKPIYRCDGSPKNPQNSLTPWTYLIHFIGGSFLILAQVNLTKHTKFVQNKESQIIFSNMGKLRSLLATAAGGLALAGCADGAEQKLQNDSNVPVDVQKVSVTVETADDIKKRCRALLSETEDQKNLKRACYAELKAMREAEKAVRDERVGKKKAEITAKTEQRAENAAEKAASEQGEQVLDSEITSRTERTNQKISDSAKKQEELKDINTTYDVLINRIANKAAQVYTILYYRVFSVFDRIDTQLV